MANTNQAVAVSDWGASAPSATSAAFGGAVTSALGGISAALDSAVSSLSGGFPVKTNAVQPFSAAGMTATQIMDILHNLDPGTVAAAGEVHTNLGSTLDTLATRLAQNAQTLAQNWSGNAAQAAMAKFQQLHDQTAILAQQATQTGSVLTWLGHPGAARLQVAADPDHDVASGVRCGDGRGGRRCRRRRGRCRGRRGDRRAAGRSAAC